MKSSELRLQRVGGKSETELVVSRSLSSTVAKSKGQNLLATELIEEKEACHDKFGPPGLYSFEIYGPPCMLSTIAEIQKGQGLGCGYKWLAGLVSRVCMAGLVFRVCMGGPHISGVQISRDRPGCERASCSP